METEMVTATDIDNAICEVLRDGGLTQEQIRKLLPPLRRFVLEHAGKEKARITLAYVKRVMREQAVLG